MTQQGDPMDYRWYSVNVEYRAAPDYAGDITDDAIGQFATALVPYDASVTGGAGYADYGARVSIPNRTALPACFEAVTAVTKAAADAGLPPAELIRVEAVRHDVLDEDLARPVFPDVVTAPEAAKILHVTRQRVHQLAAEHPGFPGADYVGSIRVWHRAAIERFNETWDRKGGWPKGRPRKTDDSAA